jgi:eukaryotic-like serine/threonine-protein kinase
MRIAFCPRFVKIRGVTQRSMACLACIDENLLAAFAEGGVDEHARSQIEEHLADCGDCRAVLTRAAGLLRSHVERSAARSDTDLEPEELAAGTHVGRYVAQGLIGRGAMGAVYAAYDPDLDRKVAVKILRADSLSGAARQQVRARLLREAKAMARLSHPEVITVYDVGSFGEQLFVAMEYIDGGTLRHWRAARHRSYGEILSVYERAGSGLAAAHEAGLVHRDFKPDNVLVARDGRVRVTDFGLARIVDGAHAAAPAGQENGAQLDDGGAITLTRTGTLLGTPAYMAPEQLRGGAADTRSDVFSFCVALYEALYGERPFSGASVAELQAAIERGAVRAPRAMTRLPRWVRAPLLRGLQAAPKDRFDSMRGLLDALRAAHAKAKVQHTRALVAGMGIVGIVAASVAYARLGSAGAHPVAPVASSSVAAGKDPSVNAPSVTAVQAPREPAAPESTAAPIGAPPRASGAAPEPDPSIAVPSAPAAGPAKSSLPVGLRAAPTTSRPVRAPSASGDVFDPGSIR